jgi:ArsR family transcriptional regulator, zinc-responsive transcriptional repressor
MTSPGVTDLAPAAALLRSIAHPLRLAIVLQLREGERCVHDLVDATGAPQPLVSQHLKVLREAALIEGRKRGREIAYTVADEHVIHIALDAITHATERTSP